MTATVLDPLALCVARRYLADVQKVRSGRLAIEYQRRTHGLERVDDDGEDVEEGDREVVDRWVAVGRGVWSRPAGRRRPPST